MDERLLKIAVLLGRADAMLESFEQNNATSYNDEGASALEDARNAIHLAMSMFGVNLVPKEGGK